MAELLCACPVTLCYSKEGGKFIASSCTVELSMHDFCWGELSISQYRQFGIQWGVDNYSKGPSEVQSDTVQCSTEVCMWQVTMVNGLLLHHRTVRVKRCSSAVGLQSNEKQWIISPVQKHTCSYHKLWFQSILVEMKFCPISMWETSSFPQGHLVVAGTCKGEGGVVQPHSRGNKLFHHNGTVPCQPFHGTIFGSGAIPNCGPSWAFYVYGPIRHSPVIYLGTFSCKPQVHLHREGYFQPQMAGVTTCFVWWECVALPRCLSIHGWDSALLCRGVYSIGGSP